MKNLVASRFTFFILVLFFVCSAISARAGSATWSDSPVNSDWQTPTNWEPAMVPNSPADMATFSSSSISDVTVLNNTHIRGVFFDSAADAFTLTVKTNMLLTGVGIINDAATPQNFVLPAGANPQTAGLLKFGGHAAIVGPVMITNNAPATNQGHAGATNFLQSASAGQAMITNNPGNGLIAPSGRTIFSDHSTAASATFVNNGNFPLSDFGGATLFYGYATADHATFYNEGSGSGPAGGTYFYNHASAGHGTFINEDNGFTQFDHLGATAAQAVIINNGTSRAGTTIHGGNTLFYYSADAGRATLIANGGTNGGQGGFIGFHEAAGPNATFLLYGNGTLGPPAVVGSLEGDGHVDFGAGYSSAQMAVGNTNRDTVFSGIIEEAPGFGVIGSLEKIGTGVFTLAGASTYQGGTTVSNGVLLVNNVTGSATGTGVVNVNAGTLGGGGIIFGAVNVGGNGQAATLQPAYGAEQSVTLTLLDLLTFNSEATYIYQLQSDLPALAAQDVVIDSGAQFIAQMGAEPVPPVGTVYIAIANAASTQITGTFANLPDGETINVNGTNLKANYEGGDGNDLTLTVVP